MNGNRHKATAQRMPSGKNKIGAINNYLNNLTYMLVQRNCLIAFKDGIRRMMIVRQVNEIKLKFRDEDTFKFRIQMNSLCYLY